MPRWGRKTCPWMFTGLSVVKPIKVFNHGDMKRDFSYEGMMRLLDHPPLPNEQWDRFHPDPSYSYAPYKIYNIGNNQPVKLLKHWSRCLGWKRKKSSCRSSRAILKRRTWILMICIKRSTSNPRLRFKMGFGSLSMV